MRRSSPRNAFLAMLICCNFAACAQGSSITTAELTGISGEPYMTDASILQYISPSLSTAEQGLMYDVLSALPERSRENVVYYDLNGVEHANKPALLAGDLSEQSSHQERLPQILPSLPPCNAGTDVGGCSGVLYQHRGPTGYGYFSATLNVPCSSTIIEGNSTSYQANNYITIVGSGGSLELGFQYNDNNSLAVKSVQPYYSTGSEVSLYRFPGHFPKVGEEPIQRCHGYEEKAACV